MCRTRYEGCVCENNFKGLAIEQPCLLWWKSFNEPSINTFMYRNTISSLFSVHAASEDDAIWTVWHSVVELPTLRWQVVWTPDRYQHNLSITTTHVFNKQCLNNVTIMSDRSRAIRRPISPCVCLLICRVDSSRQQKVTKCKHGRQALHKWNLMYIWTSTSGGHLTSQSSDVKWPWLTTAYRHSRATFRLDNSGPYVEHLGL